MKKLALLGVLFASTYGLAEPINEQALSACTLIEKDFQRLVCFDKVMANQPIDIEQTVASHTSKKTTLKQTLSNEQKFGMSKKLLKEKTDFSEAQQISATIIEVKKSPTGSRLFKLDIGQSWKQLGTNSFYAKKGDKIEIERGTLDSFLMKKVGSNRSIRVKRVD
ncbi:hypothetical protein PSECIP111951_03436 [Pseudoalteromonas holothuriae]|uniref:Type IV pilus biogenesis protein PilP n=1 Tax=Pseudoalteromonas holothuriae TaxID=2963714 RepID=A0A9W4R4Z3_9GAMM|nr:MULTISPECIES: hypothetical protein [unclassified Pseudoalteromonas]CAH9065774.1 hypothetical protein PSECIP111951_03436 [Pseudoalteromonas sp. CIP111951]CAH9066343.1 hypothetical protein PSECIP111854_03868 [Pseudoalteromonas sp. CIP111854]